MSVEVTTLPSGLVVVTDAMPHLETASLGVWVGAGSRDERPNEHGISHLLEHMAFKGTARRTARQIAEEIEAVGGDLNAATSNETTAYYARVLKADVPLGARRALRHPHRSGLRSGRAQAREERDRAGDRRGRRHAGRHRVRPSAEHRLPEPAGRPLGARHARKRVLVRAPTSLRAYLSRNYRAPDMVVVATGAIEHARIVAEVQQRCSRSFGGPAGPMPEPARYAGGTYVEQRDLEQAHLAFALEGVAATRSDAVQPAGLHQRARRRNVVAAVPGGARDPRALLHDLYLPHALCRYRHVRALCRHRRQGRAGIDAGRHRRDRARRRNHRTRPKSRAPRRR